MFWYFVIAVVSFAAGYLVKRNNPNVKYVDKIIDNLDETVEDEVKEKIKEAFKK